MDTTTRNPLLLLKLSGMFLLRYAQRAAVVRPERTQAR